MARDKIGSDLMQVRFPDGTFSQIDATGISRPEFIRDAVDAVLRGRAPALPPNGSYGVVDPAVFAPKDAPAAKKNRDKVSASKPSKSIPVQVSMSGRRTTPLREADKLAVLEFARGGRFSSRDISAAMGWPGLRYQNAENSLMADGAIRFDGSVLVCI